MHPPEVRSASFVKHAFIFLRRLTSTSYAIVIHYTHAVLFCQCGPTLCFSLTSDLGRLGRDLGAEDTKTGGTVGACGGLEVA